MYIITPILLLQVAGCDKSYTHPSSLRKHMKLHEAQGEVSGTLDLDGHSTSSSPASNATASDTGSRSDLQQVAVSAPPEKKRCITPSMTDMATLTPETLCSISSSSSSESLPAAISTEQDQYVSFDSTHVHDVKGVMGEIHDQRSFLPVMQEPWQNPATVSQAPFQNPGFFAPRQQLPSVSNPQYYYSSVQNYYPSNFTSHQYSGNLNTSAQSPSGSSFLYTIADNTHSHQSASEHSYWTTGFTRYCITQASCHTAVPPFCMVPSERPTRHQLLSLIPTYTLLNWI